MLGVLDLHGAAEKLIQEHKINEWARLLVSLTFSFLTSAAFTTGTAMVAGTGTARAIGAGLAAGASMATLIWRRSGCTKGTIVALPAEEAEHELDTPTQVITK